MNIRKNKKREDVPEFREFRSVRYYTNINGHEKTYGYDYTRDKNGKEIYREHGDPSAFELEGDIQDRIHAFESMFNLNRGFSNLFALPSLESFFNDDWFNFDIKALPGFDYEKKQDSEEERSNGEHNINYDFQEQGDNLYLIVELPGFSKEDVKIKLRKGTLHLEAKNGKKESIVDIPIKHSIDKKHKINATMQNGILEIKFKLKESTEDEGEEIRIN